MALEKHPKSNFMKRRAFRIMNFFAFNLLFFALYLNFIHKDKSIQTSVQSVQKPQVQGTVLVEDPEQYLQKGHGSSVNGNAAQKESSTTKMSLN